MDRRLPAAKIQWTALAMVLALCAGPNWGAAQESDGEPRDAQGLINAAYEKTKTAETLEDYTEVIELCERARASKLPQIQADYVNRLLAWAHNRRGEAYADQAKAALDQNDHDRADELDEQALAEFETAVKYDAQRWRAIHNRGVSYAMAGRYEEAIRDFSRTVQLKPDYANAWFNRGELRYELGRFREAISDYNQAIRLKQDDFGAHTSRGHAQFQLRRFREALADYNQAVRLAPNRAQAYANRGDAYLSLGQWERAAADYRRAIDLDANFGRAYQSAAWLMATCPDARFRNAELAIQSAERAIELDGDKDFKYLDALAAAYANANRYDEAKATLAKAIEIAPPGQADSLKQRLALYEAGKPYRQGASAPTAAAGPEAET